MFKPLEALRSQIAPTLMEPFAGLRPEEFEQRAPDFVMTRTHPELGVTYARTVHQATLELGWTVVSMRTDWGSGARKS